MMKKRVLMPLLVAGVMMASVVSLNSCQKEQKQSIKTYFENEEAPVVETVIRDDRAQANCPYCTVPLHPGDVHWHAFGEPPADCTYEFLPGDPQGVSACSEVIGTEACPYSGLLEGDTETIEYLMAHGYTYYQACAKLEPRFHGHMIVYDVLVNGGHLNTWHVGGGVPFWNIHDLVSENP